jgi:hypothetical protein
MQAGLANAVVAFGDILKASGDGTRGDQVLEASLADMDAVMKQYGRGDFWYVKDRAIALALLDRKEAAIAQIRRAIEARYGGCNWWEFFEIEPTFASLRSDPRFLSMLRGVREHAAAESAQLAQMRKEGLVPAR